MRLTISFSATKVGCMWEKRLDDLEKKSSYPHNFSKFLQKIMVSIYLIILQVISSFINFHVQKKSSNQLWNSIPISLDLNMLSPKNVRNGDITYCGAHVSYISREGSIRNIIAGILQILFTKNRLLVFCKLLIFLIIIF